ncbi:hypothetical protein NBRC3280_1860 [Acetobacter pasteurianus NBRC 3280]|uniref:Uncharacterized protein n=1 Tax=Acetobacter pasteurianus NBRC 3278 TaxID=1226660 RepID=A0A401X4V9_ACEPA|nr:hypothetical protein [Acetobacter pasteurianus]GCD59347.1 hypothetical protein NBRC3277_1922 [Acetobacter pasteurianus NBRC 3277]GCD62854.1 hypothetical protein NBRC3278_1947 [Acetobacter pasteurianus NBRC 3278]GCD69225.1 hypothetical protein NBRC3280_1860 [Acetobacter pasteurianus NBRC 3280]
MALAITVNDADFSDNSIGWEAPTNAQPATALFALNSASGLRNLAAGGLQPTTVAGTPTFTAGVSGKSLPFVTLGSNATLESNQLLTPQITVLSLLNIGTGLTNILNMSIAEPAALFTLQRGSLMNNWLVCGSGSDQLTENSNGLVTGSWQIHAWQCDITTKTPSLNYKNYTTGASAGGTGSFSSIYTPQSTFELGGSGDQAASSTHAAAVHLFWNSILGTDDMTTAVAWLRQYAQAYGISA